MEIFKRLLFPISSEFFPEIVINRIEDFIEKFNSKVFVVYIIEEKILRKIEEVAEPFLTEEQRKRIEKDVIERNKEIANIIFNKLRKHIDFEKKIVIGEFSDKVIENVKEYEATCVIMGYEKECFLKYRLFEKLHIPIWVEIGKMSKNILGVCSNLAPNIRVPKITLSLAKKLGYNPFFVYIVDVEEKVEVDEKGNKMKRSLEELIRKAKKFAEEYGKYARVEIAVGALEEEIIKFAKRLNADVIVIGREMKKRRIFGKGLKKEIADRINHSVFFLN